jgi:hypothetical protein
MALFSWLGRLPRFGQVLVVLLGLVVAFGAVGTVAFEGYARIVGMRPENRTKVYALRRSIAPGTTTEALDRLLASEENRELKRSSSQAGVSVWSPIGFMRVCYLHLELREGRIVHATIRGDKGDHDRFPDAPPDF